MPTEPVTVDLFVRSLSPAGARGRPAEVIERLRSLAEGGTIEDYAVTVWGEAVGVSSDAARRERATLVLDRVAALRSWAAERGVALDAFERREVSTPTGETYAVLEPPVLTLVESVEGELACVAPCTTDGGVITVEERLEALEERAGGSGSGRPEGPEAPPEDGQAGPREYDPVPS